MDQKELMYRAKHRIDLTTRVTHLTRGKNDDEAFKNLWEILVGNELRGGTGYIKNKAEVCCFQNVPLHALAEHVLFEREAYPDRIRYNAFGIRVHKGNLYQAGGRPVIYADEADMKDLGLSEKDYWRVVDLQMYNPGVVVDWTHESEWRIKGNFTFEYSDIEVIVKNGHYYRLFVNKCLEEGRTDILTTVNGIVTLDCLIL